MRANRTLEALRAGREVIGAELATGLNRLPALFGRCGLDFAWIDLEHTLLDPAAVGTVIQACRLSDVTPIVRVPELRPGLIRPLLDNGAQGIILPFVEHAEQAAELVAWCHFHPAGRRGVGSPGLAHDFSGVSLADHSASSAGSVLCAVQVESVAGVAEAAAIAATPGLDVVIIGLADLSVSLGVPGQVDHPEVLEAAGGVLRACAAHGVAGGLGGLYAGADRDEAYLRGWRARGVRFYQAFSDLGVLEAGIAGAAARARGELGHEPARA